MYDSIIIKGAREHNLKNINLQIPRNKLIVITGLSGSGKSSLAFDTIYAEGQRRYVESLSAYARQFLEQTQKPDVDYIEGLSPAIAIQQKAPGKNPRSTVATVTEIYDYLRLLYANIGTPHCPGCGRDIFPQSSQQIVSEILKLPKSKEIQILAPLVRGRKGEHRQLFNRVRQDGFIRVRVDNRILSLDEDISIEKNKKHSIEVVIDRLVINQQVKTRLADSVETALKIGQGIVIVSVQDTNDMLFSEHYACHHCGISMAELSPRMFSFNSPYGACLTCGGLGTKIEVDPDLVVEDRNLSVDEGAIVPWSRPITTRRHRWQYSTSRYYYQMLESVSKHFNFSLCTPFKDLTKKHQDIILYGSDEEVHFSLEKSERTVKFRRAFEGVIANLNRRYQETDSVYVREEIFNKYMRSHLCHACKGARLKPVSLSVTVAGKSIWDISSLSIKQAQEFFSSIKLTKKERIIASQILKEITGRLEFLTNVGLDYITLNRESSTLAGGEAQRIHLATQIGSGLVGVLYVLDEPTIGLHQRDNQRLLDTLQKLKNLGNTLIVVEHDEATIRKADYIIDLGPGAGAGGGEVVAHGTFNDILVSNRSLTGKYLAKRLGIPVPSKRRNFMKDKILHIIGARQFNLKYIDVKLPLGLFTCITGVSGSGKSTLVQEIIYKGLARRLYNAKEKPGLHSEIRGMEHIDKVIIVDQSPIGRTPRSNPVTYTGVFTHIRELFSRVPQSRMRGYKQGRFSFNVKGGRCERCQGEGLIKIEMQFLPDVYVTCEVCNGNRFNEETLQIRFKGKNITEVLSMSVEEALDFFSAIPKVKNILQTLYDVGLGYIKLGQWATTLSGGEAQRVKLSSELAKRSTGKTLYILDEPTTGLHFADIHKLLDVLHRLTDSGNTVLVIEHNLDVLKTADYIIDLGPEGGDKGGEIVAEGTPEHVAGNIMSYTGQFLKGVL